MEIEAKDFEKAFMKIMKDIGIEATEIVSEEIEKLIDIGNVNIKKYSPIRKSRRSKKDRLTPYSKSWKKQKLKIRDNHIIGRVYLGTKKYKISHLLEFGHVDRSGRGRVKAIPHIRKVELALRETLRKNVEKRLNGK